MPKLLSPEEAWEVISSGNGFVSAADYTYFKDGYLAYGTLPGCIRTTGHSKEHFLQRCDRQSLTQWKLMSPEDLICQRGYFPGVYSLLFWYEKIGGGSIELIQEVYKLESEMIQHCINSPHDADVFAHPEQSPGVWRTWFKQRSWDRWTYFKEHFPNEFKHVEVVFGSDLYERPGLTTYIMDENGVPTQPPE